MKRELVSFVIPCYNSTNTLEDVVSQIEDVMCQKLSQYEYEIILVNDNSKDNTKGLLLEIHMLKASILHAILDNRRL